MTKTDKTDTQPEADASPDQAEEHGHPAAGAPGDPTTSTGADDAAKTAATPAAAGKGPHHRLWGWLGSHKKLSIPLAVVAVVAVLAAVPFTRYFLAGMVAQEHFAVVVMDAETSKPVPSATVQLAGKTAKTDNQGRATIRTNVGTAVLAVGKTYYKDASHSVLIPFSQKSPYRVTLTATGRQVPVSVVDKVSGQPLANATVAAGGAQTITDKNGEALLVLPAGQATLEAVVTGEGFRKATVTVRVTTAKDPANTFALTPSGTIYFLSNASGKLDVVKSDLDGQNRQVVLAGTGKEDKSQTVLLASQDWKYLALLSKRDGGDDAKLFLIDTANDSLSTMDEGQAHFTLAGWSGHTFIYTVDRYKKSQWEPKKQALKSFQADTKKLATWDETDGSGDAWHNASYTNFTAVYILENEVVYGETAYAAQFIKDGRQAALHAIRPDGSDKRVVKAWQSATATYIGVTLWPYEATAIYVTPGSNIEDVLYEYGEGKLEAEAGKKADDIYKADYFTYLFSPSNKHTFWSEARDGKNALFVGNNSGEDKKQIGTVDEYQTYGWFTDNYLLLSKKGSELYIMPAGVLKDGQEPVKITDYYKPSVNYPGYGKGYGGY